jgi:hypothetical protein
MRNLFFLPILLVLFSSCAKKLVPLTDKLRNDYALTPEVILTLQYYVSQDIVFTADAKSAERTIRNGVIYDKKGKKTKEFIILEKTPGVCLNVGGSTLQMSFDVRYGPLNFGVYPDYYQKSDKKMDIRENLNYRLQADYWGLMKGEFALGEKNMLTDASNKYAHLFVDLRELSDIEKESEIARGRTVK